MGAMNRCIARRIPGMLERFAFGLRTGPEKGDWLTAPDGPGDLGPRAGGPGALYVRRTRGECVEIRGFPLKSGCQNPGSQHSRCPLFRALNPRVRRFIRGRFAVSWNDRGRPPDIGARRRKVLESRKIDAETMTASPDSTPIEEQIP